MIVNLVKPVHAPGIETIYGDIAECGGSRGTKGGQPSIILGEWLWSSRSLRWGATSTTPPPQSVNLYCAFCATHKSVNLY